MPRPRKCRRVCCLPRNKGFLPLEEADREQDPVILTVDEYEAIRLIDHQDFSQEECGQYMGIARTTVQQIYTQARRKLAQALVQGLPLHIRGGDYTLCEGEGTFCHCSGCPRRRCLTNQKEEEVQ